MSLGIIVGLRGFTVFDCETGRDHGTYLHRLEAVSKITLLEARPAELTLSEPGATAPRVAGNGHASAAVEGSQPSRPGSLSVVSPSEERKAAEQELGGDTRGAG